MKYLGFFVCMLVAGILHAASAADAPLLELKDGDRVAFIGDTFVEREQVDCYIETMLTSRFPDRNVTFRNLGYSADTVTGSARGLCAGWSTFEDSSKAFDRLRKLVAEFKPTVLLMNYGMTESFSGPDGLPTFVSNYNKMLDALSAAAGTSPRLILMSPNYHEDLGRPLPDPAEHNKNLLLYTDAIRQIATTRHAIFVDICHPQHGRHGMHGLAPLTSNGIHLTPYGYWSISLEIQRALGLTEAPWEISFGKGGTLEEALGTKVSDVTASPTAIHFTVTDNMLAPPPTPETRSPFVDRPYQGQVRKLTANGLKTGTYELMANGHLIETGTDVQWARGIEFQPESDQAEALRKVIVAKNFDFFNYQRPDNDSYILAFRRGEQGRNAVEIPEFLKLVAEKEKTIAELRVPKPVVYTLEAK